MEQTSQDGTKEPNTFCAGAALQAEQPDAIKAAVERRTHLDADARARKRLNDERPLIANGAIISRVLSQHEKLSLKSPIVAAMEIGRGPERGSPEVKTLAAATPSNRTMAWNAAVKVVELRCSWLGLADCRVMDGAPLLH